MGVELGFHDVDGDASPPRGGSAAEQLSTAAAGVLAGLGKGVDVREAP